MERIYEKYGWVVFLALGLLWLVVGLNQILLPESLLENDAQLVTGMSWSELNVLSPVVSNLVSWLYGSLGVLKTSWSIMVLAITLTGYQRGERWAWYTLWLAPTILVCQGIIDTILLGDSNEMLKWIPITSITLLGLLVPIRKFFPRKS